MTWLARLKKTAVAPESDPTEPTKPLFVGFVGTWAGLSQKSGCSSAPANDPTPCCVPALDPDRHCWPHSTAMNTAEIEVFTARVHLFTRHSLDSIQGEGLADGLVIRDREGDDRRLCLECLHLRRRAGLWSCNQWKRAGLAEANVPAEVVKQLQRCDGFQEATS